MPKIGVDQPGNFTFLCTVPVLGLDFFAFAVNPQLYPADGEQPDIGFGLA